VSFQRVSTDLWEVRLPEDWIQKPFDSEQTLYFEAADEAAGVYLSTWGIPGRPLREALEQLRAIELQNLPDGSWDVLTRSENESGSEMEFVTEYFDRSSNYRIVSRALGRDGFYVRLTYHDYDCENLGDSTDRSQPLLDSLKLLPQR
jgi:hypothetical protein